MNGCVVLYGVKEQSACRGWDWLLLLMHVSLVSLQAELNAFRQVELAKQQKIEAKAALKYAQDIEIREPPRGRESKF